MKFAALITNDRTVYVNVETVATVRESLAGTGALIEGRTTLHLVNGEELQVDGPLQEVMPKFLPSA